MNTESCDMVRQASSEAVYEGPPGSFYIFTAPDGQQVMRFLLPSGCGGQINIGTQVRSDAPCWQFDGNEEKPTLSPSVHQVGHWHGWFRAGRMESC